MINDKLQTELRQIYNPEGSQLRNIQLRILDILKIVDGICRRNNITYWLSSGTLLGAVRHGGFIPWDDDVDIEILRKDRNRFITACNRELPSNLHIQYHKNEPNYFLNILKVRDDSTDIGEKVHLGMYGDYETNYNCRGYFIDIFCVEPCVPFFLKISNKILYRILRMRFVSNRSVLLCHTMWMIMEFLNSIFRIIGKLLADKSIFYFGLSSCFGAQFGYKRKYIIPIIKMSFEGYDFCAPTDFESYLNDMYGDYNELPNEKLRLSHHSSLSDV